MRRPVRLALGLGAATVALALAAHLPGAVEAAPWLVLFAQHSPCANCHQVHTAPGLNLTKEAVREVLCQSCHSPTGGAAAREAHKNGAGNKLATCTDCHTPHDYQTNSGGGTNLTLVKATVTTPNSSSKSVRLESRGTDAGQPAALSFADGDVVYNGLCEVCHTQTAYHRNSSAGNHAHEPGRTCTLTCHQHDRGFVPSTTCKDCHNVAQDNGDGIPAGGRRAVVGEFSRASHHLQVTVPDSLTMGRCQVCHDQSGHQQGYVRLWRVDYPNNIDSSIVLSGNPNTDSTQAAKLTQFCLACHDANGANGNLQPFSDGVTRPLIDSTPWSTSSHKTANRGCYGNGTSGCHASGHGSLKLKLLAPDNVAATAPAYAEQEEGFCFTCHDGSPASTNVQAEFQKGTNTSTQTYHHPVNDTQQLVGRPLECSDCHNPHQATGANRLKGVTGIALDGAAVGPGTASPRDIVEYEACLKCHGDSYVASRDINGDGYGDTSNKRRDFNDSASAYHPVQQAGRNQSGALQAALVGGLTTSSTIKCSDCHNNEQTRNAQGVASNSTAGPKGPHGSVLYPVLRDTFDLRRDQSAGGARAGQFRLCFLCHDQTKLIGASSFTAGARTNYYGGSQDNLHWFHITSYGGVTCRTCHYDAHGNQSATNTIYRITDGATTDYVSPPVGYKTRMVNFAPGVVLARTGQTKPVFSINVATRARGCALVCHGMDHTGSGDFSYNPQAKHGQPGQDNDPLKYP